ncbi:MAG: phosphate transport system permease protein [Gammaproteobacteria bacterium]|jgi:phosphate transport system permease protein
MSKDSKALTLRSWYKSGSPWVWLNAGGAAISMVMVTGLLLFIASKGLVHFWPAPVFEAQYSEEGGAPQRLIAEIRSSEMVGAQRLREAGIPVIGDEDLERFTLKTGNREIYGLDFRFGLKTFINDLSYPEHIVVLERLEWGNFYGYLKEVKENGVVVASGDQGWDELNFRLERVLALREEIEHIEKSEIGSINFKLEKLRLRERGLELDGFTRDLNPEEFAPLDKARAIEDTAYKILESQLVELYGKIRRDAVVLEEMQGESVEIGLDKAVRAYKPNAYSLLGKMGHYAAKLWEFVADDPREANTEGGIFPAIFGTVIMVMVMAVLVTPFGVVAAVYLHEYARQGVVTRLIRVAVNNLAGVPSIVYGIFGLGFFVYFIGGSIDSLFYKEALPAPTFGTGGLMWASLTLALLTLPVVIVSTEEGLSRIPRTLREGSLALGSTKFETLWRVVLPMASPGIMTGLILAVARAAGEVAPLMLVGVVKLAPSLALDGNAPYLHLDRKIMHLGFHIYDVGFQSPNVEAARPLVYATALLLIVLIVLLNLAAVRIRNTLREKYRAMEH